MLSIPISLFVYEVIQRILYVVDLCLKLFFSVFLGEGKCRNKQCSAAMAAGILITIYKV